MILFKHRLALLEYKRKEYYKITQDKEYSKELFCSVLIDHKRINICSPTTYRKMLTSKSIKNEDIFIQLLQKLRLCYDEHAHVYTKEFHLQCKELQIMYERYDLDEFQHLCSMIINKLKTKDALEIEHKKVLLDIVNILKSQCISVYDPKRMEEIVDAIDIFEPSIQTLLEKPIFNHFIDTHKETNIGPFLNKMPKCHLHDQMMLYYRIDIGQLDQVEKDMNTLIAHYEKSHYENMVFTIMLSKLKYEFQIGSESESTLHEIKKYYEQHELHPDKYISYLYFVAKKYNREKNYIKAKTYFEKLLEISPDMTGIVLGYYFHTLLELNERLTYDAKLASHMSLFQKKMYRYFEIPSSDYVKREQYIIKILCKEHVLNDTYLVVPFLRELQKIVKITKHYVLLNHYLTLTDDFL